MTFDPIYKPKKYLNKKYEALAQKYPHKHVPFFNRPDLTRRRFFEVAGAGVVGSYLAGNLEASETLASGATVQNTAQNCIFILLTGAISAWDSFDLKTINGATPAAFQPTTINGTTWPAGLLPKLGQQLGNMVLVRSMSAHALVHSLGQAWSQIGRNPAAALGNIAPNIGSVVAIEKDPLRTPGQVFPAFVALNSPSGVGQGYFDTTYAPFRISEPSSTTTTGVPDTSNANGQTGFNTMFTRLHQYDDGLRVNSPYGPTVSGFDAFYSEAQGMMYNQAVTQAFNFSAADSTRYGASTFGNSCLIAKQILAANQGTRFIQISYGSWDMHVDIYGTANPKGNNMFTMAPALDNGVSAMLADLQSSGLLDQTLVVMVGEFGRTPGGLTPAGGRDHYLLQTAAFAGAGIKGGKVIGATSADGSTTTDFGWNGSGGSGPRNVWPEDVEATIYSALGIDYLKVRMDDPFHRGFEYVPFANEGTYGPVNELWT
jgi:hypothetical protein